MTEQQILRSDTSDSLPSPEELWRDEIQARVARYRTRRGRRVEGTYSMRFPFGSEEQEAPKACPVPAKTEIEPEGESNGAPPEPFTCETITPTDMPIDSVATEVSILPSIDMSAEEAIEDRAAGVAADLTPELASPPMAEGEPDAGSASEFSLEADLEPLPPPAPRPPARRKIIAFPRQATNQEEVYRLADPVISEQPRILDVPEELEPFPTTPLLEGLELPAPQSLATSPDHIELPFQAASISRRVSAGLVDVGAVIAGSAIFAVVAYKLMPKLQPGKTLMLAAAAAPILLWAVYQYLMMMYAGTTAGLQLAKLRVCTFKGDAPNQRHRRSRVIGLYLSSASLLMGLLWSLVDVDALCWHDRISHTYLIRRD